MARTEKKGPMKTPRKLDAAQPSNTDKALPAENTLPKRHPVKAEPDVPSIANDTASLRRDYGMQSIVTAVDKASGEMPSPSPAVVDSPSSEPLSGTDCSTLDATALDTFSPAISPTKVGDKKGMAVERAEAAGAPQATDAPHRPSPAGMSMEATTTTNLNAWEPATARASPAAPGSPNQATGNANSRATSGTPPPPEAPNDTAPEAAPSGRRKRSRKVPAKLADAAVLSLSGRARSAVKTPAKRPRDDATAAAAAAPPATDSPLPEASTATAVHVSEQTPSTQATVAALPPARRRRKGAPTRADD